MAVLAARCTEARMLLELEQPKYSNGDPKGPTPLEIYECTIEELSAAYGIDAGAVDSFVESR